MQNHLLSLRRAEAKRLREAAAEAAYERPPVAQVSNGEETDYRNPGGALSYVANFSKSLRHNRYGEVFPEDYQALVRAMTSGNPDHFEALTLARPDGLNLVNPQAGFAFELQGPDARSLAIRPAPRIDSAENSAEMGELYWMALLRDVPFSDYAAGNQLVDDAVADMNAFGDFRGPKDAAGAAAPETLFRGITLGDLAGPYVSQFLLVGNRDMDAAINPPLDYDDGWITYGSLKIDQRQKTAQAIPQNEFMTDFQEWRAVQRGADRRIIKETFEPNRLFVRTMRDLATYVHYDALYEAYLNACLILLSIPTPFDPGNPYASSRTQEGFGTFGGPHILSLVTEVATRALKAVWYQKWGVHRRLRPEAFAGRVHVHRNGRNAAGDGINRYDGIINAEILASAAIPAIEAKYNGNALLPMAFPEGSPAHPAYGAGHATVAGACVTILKAWFDESFVLPWAPLMSNAAGTALVNAPGAPDLTVGGELNKVAANVALGRNGAGVHWRTDYSESIKLGEAVAIGLLQEQKLCYNEDSHLSLTTFDGTAIVI